MKLPLRLALSGLLACLPMHAAEIHVSAAASLADSIQEIARSHQVRSGVIVRLNLAGSNALARQIEEGAPVDVFVSADVPTMDKLTGNHLLIRESRVALLTNSLVVIAPADSPLSIRDAADLVALERLALGDPASVPVGIYARKWLEGRGQWQALRSKVIGMENARATLAAVESGNVDAGVVYATDAAASKAVKVLLVIPADEAPAILYPAALCRDSPDPAAAREFLDFLRSDDARAIFKRHGFGIAGSRP